MKSSSKTVHLAHRRGPSDDDRFFRIDAARWLSGRIGRSTLEIAAGIHVWVLIDHEQAARTIIRHAQ